MVVGGGCYGTFYASQLAKAKARGKAEYRTVIVVDRNPDCQARRDLGEASDRRFVTTDWTSFFDEWLSDAPRTTHDARDDQIVPSPHMPHLMFEWLLRRARGRWPSRVVSVAPVPGDFPTPYDRPGSDHTRYVSWMADSVRDLADRLRASGGPVSGPALFVCKHQVFGVGMFAAEAVRAGDRLVEAAAAGGAPAEVLVGTISSCHGALNLLRIADG